MKAAVRLAVLATVGLTLVPLPAPAQTRVVSPTYPGRGTIPRPAEAATITRTNPSALSTPAGYSHVVVVTGAVKTIYIAGQVAVDRDGTVVGVADMKAQAEQVFRNLGAALAAAGAGFADVVKMTIYVTDMAQAPGVREVRARYFGPSVPASTLVQVAALARPELMIEIEVVAAVPAAAR
jgi:reactive intermediate/imine deaminase